VAIENPYTAPTAPNTDASPEILEGIRRRITGAWVAAIVSGSTTLVVTLIAMSCTEILGFSSLELFDVALIFGLAFGIYKKSRTSAVAMLIYFVASKIVLSIESGVLPGIVLSVVFVYFSWQGVSGTFAYHRLTTRSPG
jgi:hypothetical protein